jgi:phosphohistidine phosphatase
MSARLVVVRHAKSDYPWGVVDHDRPLNERGRRDAPEIGAWLDAHLDWDAAEPPVVLVSTARRAQLTWGLARERLSARWQEVEVLDEPRIYEAYVGALVDVVREAGREHPTVVLVGHNPGLAELVERLAVDDDLKAEATSKFPTSAVAVLESDVDLPQALDQRDTFRVTAFAVPRG